MIRYEILLLTVPEITSHESRDLETTAEKIIRSHKASTISFERWGKYRLAYPVIKHDYGVYFLLRFEAPKEEVKGLIADLHALFTVKLNDIVMRHVVRYLPTDAPLSYHRPESLEEVPTRDVETFLKESKMTGLLSKTKSTRSKEPSAGAKPAEESPQPETKADTVVKESVIEETQTEENVGA